MLVRLDNSGHYPEQIVDVSVEEFEKMKQYEKKYGYICGSGDKEFCANIAGRPDHPLAIPTVLWYC